MKVSNSKAGQEVIKVYSCAYHRERGSCKNSLRRPVAKVDAVVIDWIRETVLTEAVITGALAELRRRIKAPGPARAPQRSRTFGSKRPTCGRRSIVLCAQSPRLTHPPQRS